MKTVEAPALLRPLAPAVGDPLRPAEEAHEHVGIMMFSLFQSFATRAASEAFSRRKNKPHSSLTSTDSVGAKMCR